jgi:hypothetical protein
VGRTAPVEFAAFVADGCAIASAQGRKEAREKEGKDGGCGWQRAQRGWEWDGTCVRPCRAGENSRRSLGTRRQRAQTSCGPPPARQSPRQRRRWGSLLWAVRLPMQTQAEANPPPKKNNKSNPKATLTARGCVSEEWGRRERRANASGNAPAETTASAFPRFGCGSAVSAAMRWVCCELFSRSLGK